MPRINARLALVIAAVGIAALALAACGDSGSDSSTASTAASSDSSTGASSGTVALADNPDLGQILVDANGMTVYLFEMDTSADASTCSAECAAGWPPVTSKGKVTAGSGIDASKLTTFKRDDGSTQVAYAGHPLYTFAGDAAPGDTTGNGSDAFGAAWFALTPAGDAAEGSGGDTSTAAPTGGYSY